MLPLDRAVLHDHLFACRFSELFTQEMGWDWPAGANANPFLSLWRTASSSFARSLINAVSASCIAFRAILARSRHRRSAAGSNAKSPRRSLDSLGPSALWSRPRLAFFCSAKCPGEILLRVLKWVPTLAGRNDVVLASGFHTPVEPLQSF